VPLSDPGWYARINRDGSLTINQLAWQPFIEQELDKLAANPQEYAASYGKKFGSCCFCHRSLSDSRSLAVGYGPECASKYGLPWGD
jgi:hypothetical protein